jgi:glycosyltransferase involved in cell wall biosynthesis
MISCLVLTKDEGVNLPNCLAALSWCDDVFVVDSGSSDDTVRIAEAAGAKVIVRPWVGEREQRSFCLTLPFRYGWVFNPDADEVATPQLVSEMQRAVAAAAADDVLFRVRRKDMFMGRWIKYSSLYPTYLVRLFRPSRIRYTREINLDCLPDGNEYVLQEHLLHYSFGKGLKAWVDKHNVYSDVEALETLEEQTQPAVRCAQLLSSDPVVRRRLLKRVSLRLPCRPVLRFCYMYIFRTGFLDGVAGWNYCLLIGFYELLIVLKATELKQKKGSALPLRE